MNYEAMLKNVNTFGGLTSEAGIRDFFKPEVLDWYLNDKTGLYVILENGSFRASVPASDFDAALIFYANRIVSSALRREADRLEK